MAPHSITYALLIALAGGVLQGTVGFGFGLLSVPLLLAVGYPMPMVLAIASICTAVQTTNGVHHLRHVVPWKIVGVSTVLRAITLFLGIGVLYILSGYPITALKFWIGLVMLLLLVVQVAWQPRPRAKLHAGWDAAAFLASGLTAGLCSMGGPPLVLWVMAHDWSADRTRAFLFAAFMSLIPLQLAVLYWTFGNDVLRGMALGAAFAPAVLLGSFVGLRLGARSSKPFLRRLAFCILTAVALNSMVPQLLLWLQRA